MRDSIFTRELRQQVARARQLMLASRHGEDDFTAAAYAGRLRELEELAARHGVLVSP